MIKQVEKIEFYSVEDTGWSDGASWFSDSVRYPNFEEAFEVATHRKNHGLSRDMLHRIVHTEIIREATRTITIETYTKVE